MNEILIIYIYIFLFYFDQEEKAKVIQTLLFVSGLNTLLQTWFGTRLPVVIGGSFRYIIPTIFVVLANRYNQFVDPRQVSFSLFYVICPVLFLLSSPHEI